jgi:hypothetical protein
MWASFEPFSIPTQEKRKEEKDTRSDLTQNDIFYGHLYPALIL